MGTNILGHRTHTAIDIYINTTTILSSKWTQLEQLEFWIITAKLKHNLSWEGPNNDQDQVTCNPG